MSRSQDLAQTRHINHSSTEQPFNLIGCGIQVLHVAVTRLLVKSFSLPLPATINQTLRCVCHIESSRLPLESSVMNNSSTVAQMTLDNRVPYDEFIKQCTNVVEIKLVFALLL